MRMDEQPVHLQTVPDTAPSSLPHGGSQYPTSICSTSLPISQMRCHRGQLCLQLISGVGPRPPSLPSAMTLTSLHGPASAQGAEIHF